MCFCLIWLFLITPNSAFAYPVNFDDLDAPLVGLNVKGETWSNAHGYGYKYEYAYEQEPGVQYSDLHTIEIEQSYAKDESGNVIYVDNVQCKECGEILNHVPYVKAVCSNCGKEFRYFLSTEACHCFVDVPDGEMCDVPYDKKVIGLTCELCHEKFNYHCLHWHNIVDEHIQFTLDGLDSWHNGAYPVKIIFDKDYDLGSIEVYEYWYCDGSEYDTWPKSFVKR